MPDKTLERVEDGQPTRFENDRLNLALNYSLQETDKYMFNAVLRYNYEDTPKEFSDRTSMIHASDSDDPLQISDHSTWRGKTPSLDLYYQRNLKNDQLLIFNIVGTYIDSRSTRLYQEINEENDLSIYSSVLGGDKYSLIAEGIYEKSFKSGKLSAGLKHTQSYTKNKYEGGDVATDIGLNFAETYAFVEYQLRKNKFNYTFGLGAMRSYNSQGGATVMKNTYSDRH